jgi:hypothetical protein
VELESRVQTLEEWKTRVHPDLYGDGYSHGIIREMHEFMAVQADRSARAEKSDHDREISNTKTQTITIIIGVLIAFLTLVAPWVHSWIVGAIK